MSRDPRVDDYIARAAPFARPILEHLRALVHMAIPDAGEAIKWGMPHFTFRGKNVAGMAAFKAHCSFGIHGDGSAVEGIGQFGRIASLGDLPDGDDLRSRLSEACKRIENTGTALKRSKPRAPKPELTVPADFARALAGNPAAKATLEGFAPSHRREYVEWIVDAKREETRARRIAQAIEWLAEGKRRNWKYEGC